MKKVADFLVEKRYFVMTTFIVAAILCIFLSTKVNINYDITKYLPKTSETRQGTDIMKREFGREKSSTLSVMFQNVEKEEEKLLSQLSHVKGVSSVDYDSSSTYHKDNYTLYILHVDDYASSQLAKEVYETVKEKFKDYNIVLSGSINDRNQPVLHIWIVVLAICFAMIILIIMCDSYIEPFLFLFTIGIAVMINKGTNLMFDSVSNITDSICAVLQMALSMDYSIMLMNRYTQEKSNSRDRKIAMKNALQKAFGSICSSSITTIVGLSALVFMSFTIGKDLGFVLAKGVLLSLICILCVLPGLILLFDKWIDKTKKKHLTIKLDSLGKFSYNVRHGALALFIILFVGSFVLKGNLKILYTGSENDEVASIFPKNNQMAIVYNNQGEEKIANICRNIENDKVEKVLCYGNTINEKLKYKDLKNRIQELGSNIEVDDYLLRIIYYHYYMKDIDNAITLSNFIEFIENDVYPKENIANHINDETKNNMNRLKYFAYEDQITSQRTENDLATILGIDKSSLNKLLMLYHADYVTTTLNIKEFVDFMERDVVDNPTFSSYMTEDMKNSLNTLKNFVDKDTLYTEYNSTDMANIFGMEKETINKLYLYYYSINGVDTTLTMYEFSSFILDKVVTNPEYNSMFDQETIDKLKLLNTFSNPDIVNTKQDINSLSTLFGIEKEKVLAILLLKNANQISSTNQTVESFLEYVKYLKENTNYLDNLDLSSLEQVINIYEKVKEKLDLEMDKENLTVIFQDLDSNLVENVYTTLGLDESKEITIEELCDAVLAHLQPTVSTEVYDVIQTLKNTITSNIGGTLYKTGELSIILNLGEEKMAIITEAFNKAKQSLTDSPKELVEFILSNLDNDILKESIDDSMKNQLIQVKTIMDNLDNKMDATTMGNAIGIDENTVKSLYALYSQDSIHLNKKTLVNFLLEKSEDSTLSSIPKDIFEKLRILQKVMDGVENNTKYSYHSLASTLGIDKDTLKLLYSYYDITNGYHQTASLIQFVEFILNNVINNNQYRNSIDNNSVTKLNAIHTIMKDSLNHTEYTSSTAYEKLAALSNTLDYNLIDLVYLYYSSIYDYNSTYKLTVEEFVNYLNTDILTEEKFAPFLNQEMKDKIISSQKDIKNAKKQLVGSNYSRVVIDSRFAPEDEDTFTFIGGLKKQLNGTKDTYLIGDSPMAYDLDDSFGNEFNYISILTMLLIFFVVFLTFKSVIIPLILTLVIQCAVYITMSIISIFSGSLYFISVLIVQSILMGATIDYAILFTSYYLEYRKTYNKKGALIFAYNQSIRTILTSASVLIIVTFVVGFFASAIAAKICMTVSQGTLCATILVLFILPAILASLDKIIVKNHTK